MKDFNGYLICSDLDHTFIDDNGNLIQKNLDALDYYMENSGLFTLSTGRTAEYLNTTYGKELKFNTHLICLNGTMLFDWKNQKILYSNTLDRSKILQIDKFLPLADSAYFYTKDNCYFTFAQVPENDSIYKIVLVFGTEDRCLLAKDIISKHYDDICDLNRSWPFGLEIINKGAGKGDCIRHLKEILGDKAKTVIAVGDFENDITMIKEADIGVAVSNAIDQVKTVADRITVSNQDGAIAKIIEDIKKELQ